MEFRRKNGALGQFSVKFALPNPLQNANFIKVVLSASLNLLPLLVLTHRGRSVGKNQYW